MENKQIQHHIQLRCNNYDEDLTQMINLILNRDYRRIVLDRLLYKDPIQGTRLITDPLTIKRLVVTHFQQYALPNTTPPSMNDRWTKQFTPKEFINEEWYISVMTSPT